MAKMNCLVILGFADGSFEAILDPNKLIGYRPNAIWFFGNPETTKENELFARATITALGSALTLNRIN